LAKAYAFLGTTHADITNAGGDYTGDETDHWNGGVFHGIPVINNGVDNPQMWNLPGLGTALVDITAWPASTSAKVVRPFRNFLVALDVTKAGVRYSRMVKWSHRADPDAMPDSWDETDATKDTGEQSLEEGEEELVDCATLGNSNYIYTEVAAWEQALIGGPSIFAFRKKFPSVGMLTQGCAGKFQRRHFVVTANDIVVHDGSQVQSVADGIVRKWFFANLSSSNFRQTRVIPQHSNSEMWICFPSTGASAIDTALVWNWVFNSWTGYMGSRADGGLGH
jgi:hypothetical protein